MGKATTFLTNVKDIDQAVDEYKNIIFQIYALNADIEKRISDILVAVLNKSDRINLKNLIFTILRELIVNALRANYKRVHFIHEDLDINNENDYTNGINNFKELLAENPDFFIEATEKNKLFVQVSLVYKDETILASVINNTAISPSELKRIKKQVQLAEQLNDLSEAVESMMDFSEGAGLGIPMIILMLKNAGGTVKSFNIASNEQITKVQVTIPKSTEKGKIGQEWSKKIIEEVKQLPSFPENITRIQRMINDENASMVMISEEVKKDPSLVADLLRVANSVGYATLKRVESIDEALKNIGLKGLSNLLTATATEAIISNRYKKVFHEVWNHSIKTAFFTDRLAFILRLKQIKDQAYLAGLLHDLGKIVLMSMNPKTMHTLDKELKKENLVVSSIEEISLGFNHSDVGALIGEHWKFATPLVEAIRLHHQPLLAKKESIDLVYLTYLANIMLDIERGYGDFVNIEQHVLDHFKLSEEKAKELFERVNAEFLNMK